MTYLYQTQYTEKKDIQKWLKKHLIKDYIIHDDLSVSVNKSVNLNNENLAFIPIQFNVVNGDFSINGNKLTTLKGLPYEVNGCLNATHNHLINLNFFPKMVKGSISLNNNLLETLEGLPSHVNDLDVKTNKLKTLKGAPKIVEKSFNCSFNQLSTLEGGPEIVKLGYYCSNNQLVNLDFAPNKTDTFYAMRNKLTTLKGSLKEVKIVNVGENPLKKFNSINFKCDELHIFKTELGQLNNYEDIKNLDINKIIDTTLNFPNEAQDLVSINQVSGYTIKVYILNFKIYQEKLMLEKTILTSFQKAKIKL